MQLLFSWQCVSNDPLAANNSELFLDPKLAGNYTSNDGDWTRPAGRANRQVEYVCGEAGNSGTFFEEGEYLCEVTLPTTSKPNRKDPTETDYMTAPHDGP